MIYDINSEKNIQGFPLQLLRLHPPTLLPHAVPRTSTALEGSREWIYSFTPGVLCHPQTAMNIISQAPRIRIS